MFLTLSRVYVIFPVIVEKNNDKIIDTVAINTNCVWSLLTSTSSNCKRQYFISKWLNYDLEKEMNESLFETIRDLST